MSEIRNEAGAPVSDAPKAPVVIPVGKLPPALPIVPYQPSETFLQRIRRLWGVK